MRDDAIDGAITPTYATPPVLYVRSDLSSGKFNGGSSMIINVGRATSFPPGTMLLLLLLLLLRRRVCC